ncbi:hypothetical protein O6H91_15G013400 [Diphasiastrum complanatum]|uniref:Uncharacterized protein n=2 Tax=Diphasiastrum complanatum TaxID=34168 RepID=A0ACC2BFQ7_DIPCM|nr:hypothetical protein O6H91_15G009200 [Diphasiastrum complanatum]KAJ7528675.1 hypothetical protein O6H91_15G013400 [Diphasiastrum complanatum]
MIILVQASSSPTGKCIGFAGREYATLWVEVLQCGKKCTGFSIETLPLSDSKVCLNVHWKCVLTLLFWSFFRRLSHFVTCLFMKSCLYPRSIRLHGRKEIGSEALSAKLQATPERVTRDCKPMV